MGVGCARVAIVFLAAQCCGIHAQEQHHTIASLTALADRNLAQLIKPESNRFASCLHDSIRRLELVPPENANQARDQLYLLKEQICPIIESTSHHSTLLASYLKPLQDELNADAPFTQCKIIWHGVLDELYQRNGSLQLAVGCIADHVVALASQNKIDEAAQFLQSCPALYRYLIERSMQLVYGWDYSIDNSGRVPRINYAMQGLALTHDSLIISACNKKEAFKLKVCKYKNGWHNMLYCPAKCPEILHIHGDNLITASPDGLITCVDLDEGAFKKQWHGHGMQKPYKTRINAIACYDADHIVTAGDDAQIALWRVDTGALVRTFAADTKAVCALAVLDHKILSGSDDGTVRLWHNDESKKVEILDAHDAVVKQVAFINDDLIVSCSGSNQLHLYSRSKKQVEKKSLCVGDEHKSADAAVAQLAVIADKIIYSCTGDKKIRIFDPISESYRQSFDASTFRSSFARNGSTMVTYFGLYDIVIKQAADWRTIVLMSAWRMAKKDLDALNNFSTSKAVNELAGAADHDWHDKIESRKKKLLAELPLL